MEAFSRHSNLNIRRVSCAYGRASVLVWYVYVFPRRDDSHLLVHTEGRPYLCYGCKKAYGWHFTLKHYRMHVSDSHVIICMKAFNARRDHKYHHCLHTELLHSCTYALSVRNLFQHPEFQDVSACSYRRTFTFLWLLLENFERLYTRERSYLCDKSAFQQQRIV